MKKFSKLLVLAVSTLLLGACGSNDNSPVIIDIDDSGETNTNTGTRTETGTDTDTSSETDTGSETGTGSETETETDTQTETNTDTETGSSSETDTEPVGDITLKFIEAYNGNCMRFEYNYSPFNYQGHKADGIKSNGVKVMWFEDLPDAKAFNVMVGDITLTEYIFEFMEKEVTYLTVTATVEQEGDPYVPGGELIDFELEYNEVYGDLFAKVSAKTNPFSSKYDFSYYTVNDGEHQDWFVIDGELFQIRLGTNDAGDYSIKFYDSKDAQYGFGNITVPAKN